MSKFLRSLKPITPPSPRLALAVAAGALFALTNTTEVFADGLEQAIDKVDTLFKGKIIKAGVGISAAIGFIRSIMSGNLGLAFGIIGICVGFFFLMGWISAENFMS